MKKESFNEEVWAYVASIETTKIIKQAIYSKRVSYNYEDILQEVRCELHKKFIRNPEKFEKVRSSSNFGLLRTICMGLVIDQIRIHNRRHLEVSLEFLREVNGE